MPLTAKSPTAVQKRLKLLLYGVAGSGKTTACIQFPRPYLIDTERGAENSQYIAMLEQQQGALLQTANFDDIKSEIMALMTEEHPYKTLIIDPLTTVYSQLVEQAEAAVGHDFGKHYLTANKQMKSLLALLLRLDMNVIITAHAKNEYGKDMTVLGQTFDCYKKLDYLFDLVIEIQKQHQDRFAIIKKSRIATLKEQERFPFSYQVIADKYGKDVLEKKATAIPLATAVQVQQLQQLLQQKAVPDNTLHSWLSKAKITDINEFTQAQIDLCINKLRTL